MKKGQITKLVAQKAKQAYGLESAFNEESDFTSRSVQDLEARRHQRFTDRIMTAVDYSGMAIIGSSVVGYVTYKAITKVPEVIMQLSQASDSLYEYLQPFISS